MPYESWEAIIKLFNNYSSIASEAKYKRINGKGILSISSWVARGNVPDLSNVKILSPKQMVQRLAIALLQVKAGNTSEKLLNEIRKIIYSLYWAKEITGKEYNNIMNSIKLQSGYYIYEFCN